MLWKVMYTFLQTYLRLEVVKSCLGFGWDRANFHKKLGGVTQVSQ